MSLVSNDGFYTNDDDDDDKEDELPDGNELGRASPCRTSGTCSNSVVEPSWLDEHHQSGSMSIL